MRSAMRCASRDRFAARQIAPDLAPRSHRDRRARRAGCASMRPIDALHGVVVAHRLQRLRRLAARELDGRIERGAGDAERGRGKAHAEHHVGGELVQRALLAPRRGFVAQRCKFFRDEEIFDRIGIGAGAAQADHVPDVVHRGARHRKQDGADLRRTVRLAPRRAVGLDDPDMGAEPARLPGAGGKVPARAGLVAARNRLHFMVDRAPGQNAGRDVEDLVAPRRDRDRPRSWRRRCTGRGTTRSRRRPWRPPPASA